MYVKHNAVVEYCVIFKVWVNTKHAVIASKLIDAVELYVTEFWKITLMGASETIEFTTILLASQKHILNISTLFLVIQCIFIALEP